MLGYVVAKGARFYAVIYDGIDPTSSLSPTKSEAASQIWSAKSRPSSSPKDRRLDDERAVLDLNRPDEVVPVIATVVRLEECSRILVNLARVPIGTRIAAVVVPASKCVDHERHCQDDETDASPCLPIACPLLAKPSGVLNGPLSGVRLRLAFFRTTPALVIGAMVVVALRALP